MTLVLSAIALALFFGGAGYVFGPINDVLIAITFFLLVPGIVAVQRLAGGRVGAWFAVASVLAIIGLVEAAVGQLLLVVGVISLQTSFMTFGVGVLPFVAWGVGLVVVTRRHRIVSRAVGWWAVAFLAVSAASAAVAATLPMSMAGLALVVGLPLGITLTGWLVALGLDLLNRGPSEVQPG